MKTLLQHLESLNAQAQAWMDANPGDWCSKWTTDLDHWAEYGVYTADDFIRHNLIASISDASKDLFGFRMRMDWDSMTTEDLQKEYDSICESLHYEFEREQEWEAERLEEERIAAQGLQLDCEPLPYEEYAYLEELV